MPARCGPTRVGPASPDGEEPSSRGHAAWALGRIASAEDATEEVRAEVGGALRRRMEVEEDGWVREELELTAASMAESPGGTGRGAPGADS